jgi:hypothetical protein
VDEARTVIRRLERIEALQSEEAPAAALLTEVRQLLREGEAWLAAERDGAASRRAGGEARPAPDVDGTGSGGEGTAGAAAALAGCREKFAERREVAARTVEGASL